MSLSIFLLWLVSISLFAYSVPQPRGFLINCGASNETTIGDLKYIPDDGFVYVGNKTTIKTPDVLPVLSTLRYFPDKSAKKYCYMVPVVKGGKYLVRTTYYYGGFDGGNVPPVFDQIIEGTMWGVVNTTENYARGLSSYYEIIIATTGKTLSVCVARNQHTASDPFISVLEVESLDDSVYNSTDFHEYALSTVVRDTFGQSEGVVVYPDDIFNRYWEPFVDGNPVVQSQAEVDPSHFWNEPPAKVFATAITTSTGNILAVKWPTFPLPESYYYVSLYFQDNRPPSFDSWRVFDVAINGENFYRDLNVTAQGVNVYAAQWPLSGQMEITMTPKEGMPVGPIINAAEIFQILPLDGRTLTRDVIVMEDLARTLNNPPSGWTGDPCLPEQHSWTGVTCSKGKFARIVSLNLTGSGLTGSLPSDLGKLTALQNLWLGGNSLSGTLPEMKWLKELQSLHLEDNQLEGPIPKSLGQLPKLREIFLQNNKFNGSLPATLENKDGLNVEGNNLS